MLTRRLYLFIDSTCSTHNSSKIKIRNWSARDMASVEWALQTSNTHALIITLKHLWKVELGTVLIFIMTKSSVLAIYVPMSSSLNSDFLGDDNCFTCGRYQTDSFECCVSTEGHTLLQPACLHFSYWSSNLW